MTVDPLVERERGVQSKLRAGAVLVQLAGTVAFAISLLDIDRWDWSGTHTVADAWDWAHRGWLVAVLLPAAWVMREPRKKVVLAWAAWFIAVSVAFELFVRGQTAEWESTSPSWVKPALTLLVVAIGVVVMFVLPILRLKTPEPPGLPEARIRTE